MRSAIPKPACIKKTRKAAKRTQTVSTPVATSARLRFLSAASVKLLEPGKMQRASKIIVLIVDIRLFNVTIPPFLILSFDFLSPSATLARLFPNLLFSSLPKQKLHRLSSGQIKKRP